MQSTFLQANEMGFSFKSLAIVSPTSCFNPSIKRPSTALCHLRRHPSSHRSDSFFQPQGICLNVPPKEIGFSLPALRHGRLTSRSIVSFAASHEEAKQDDPKLPVESPQEAWKMTLDSFREQALKMQYVSHEAYEEYIKKAMVILSETSEQLKTKGEKAKADLSVLAMQISEESKAYLSTAAEKSPKEVKDIVETFASSANELNETSKVRDFYLGIPYGILLSCAGFLSFMLTGSVSAIRFGIIFGGTLLALSISSLRSWRKGESSSLALRGQAAISMILFFRETSLLFVRPSFPSYLSTFLSGAMVIFYAYRIAVDGGWIVKPGK